MEGRKVCGVTAAQMESRTGWIKREIAWHAVSNIPNVGITNVYAVFTDIFAAWRDAVEGVLSFTMVDTPSAADIVITSGPIDKPFGVLAWSELPTGNDARLLQRYDSADQFTIDIGVQGSLIGLHETGGHEVGHALGLDHDPDQSALMRATYVPGRWQPQAADIAKVRAIYPKITTGTPAPSADNEVVTGRFFNAAGRMLSEFSMKRERRGLVA